MILIIDNFDSFTYNLAQYIGECGAELDVRRNDSIDIAAIRELKPAGIMLSPGPGTPKESGVCRDILAGALAGGIPELNVPIFGVCLGHQTMAEVAGGTVGVANAIRHGKASKIRHDGLGLFSGMPNPFTAIRYHSLVVDPNSVPSGFIVTATSEDDGEIMGLRHENLPIEGVQFHPESILTESGLRIVENFVRMAEPAKV